MLTTVICFVKQSGWELWRTLTRQRHKTKRFNKNSTVITYIKMNYLLFLELLLRLQELLIHLPDSKATMKSVLHKLVT